MATKAQIEARKAELISTLNVPTHKDYFESGDIVDGFDGRSKDEFLNVEQIEQIIAVISERGLGGMDIGNLYIAMRATEQVLNEAAVDFDHEAMSYASQCQVLIAKELNDRGVKGSRADQLKWARLYSFKFSAWAKSDDKRAKERDARAKRLAKEAGREERETRSTTEKKSSDKGPSKAELLQMVNELQAKLNHIAIVHSVTV